MSISFRRIWAILKKEFIQLKRDVSTLKMVIAIPIMQLIMFGFAINSDPKNLATAVLSSDHGIIARNIITGLNNSGYFTITDEIKSERDARSLLQEGLVTFVVTIPEGFTRDLIRGAKPYLLVEADATDPVAISGALGILNQAVASAVGRDTYGMLETIAPSQPPYEVRVHRLYNPEGISRYNIVPGLIAIVLTMTCVMMTALSLTKERERGTMENLLSMPVKPIEVMAGKIAPYIIIGYIQFTIILLAAYFVFKVPILGSLFLLVLGLFMFIVCNLALGFTLSTAAQNQMQAMQSSTFLLLPSILLSGFMFPFRGMPEWAQMIGSCLPATYLIRIVRGVMLKGGTLSEIWHHMWPLCIFMVVITIIAMKVYKTNLD
ncbi:ABC transporter, M_7a subfamily [Candidatus Phycorickettsia trachydisci]|uniref:ABC transporter, M_7a subfamily n=1 Tax=Candidatus Phycorickettsia trachydisci TaxID=2115978 RepID=A0A2P1P8R0_9RICK|nr:ABC transporter permease [Candidatus Phycorickettsia trachydisci]AVP87646.1 ABC transporter, M_7a subfamily [Candidatus Phycorickettsia trachydisci]